MNCKLLQFCLMVAFCDLCFGFMTIYWVWCLFGLNLQAVRMSTPARKRLMRDFKRLQQDPPAGISGAPQDNNIMLWNAVIFGYVAKWKQYSFISIYFTFGFCVGFFLNVLVKYRSDTVVLMLSIDWIAGLMTPHGTEVKLLIVPTLISCFDRLFFLCPVILKLHGGFPVILLFILQSMVWKLCLVVWLGDLLCLDLIWFPSV